MGWYSNYAYRKKFTINGSVVGAQTDYQLPLLVCKVGRLNSQKTKYAGNPVLNLGAAGKFDDEQLHEATVWKEGVTYHMLYCGYDGTRWQIGYATSPDGTTWTRQNLGDPVLTQGAPGKFDEKSVSSPSIIKEGAVYYMWYDGTNNAGTIAVGLAHSNDLITWTRDNGGDPVMSPSEVWEGLQIQAPCVVKEGTTYIMFYNNQAQTQIGYATSPDKTTWTKYALNPVLANSGAGWDANMILEPQLVKREGIYYLFYEGQGADGHDRAGAAWGTTLNTWTRSGLNPLLDIGAPGAWDDFHTSADCVMTDVATRLTPVVEGGVFKVWFTGEAPVPALIGYATLTMNDAIAELLGHSLNYPNDIRFTQSNGSTLLDYWIETTNSEETKMWVEFDSIPISPGTVNFYIYYAKAAASASDGLLTFLFFDDFPGAVLDPKWTSKLGNYVVGGGLLTLTRDAGNPDTFVATYAGAGAKFGVDREFYHSIKAAPAVQYNKWGFSPLDDVDGCSAYFSSLTNYLRNFDAAASDVAYASSLSAAAFIKQAIRRHSTTKTTIYENDVLMVTNNTQVGDGIVDIGWYLWNSNHVVIIDFVFVRKFVDPEPANGAWGAEEKPSVVSNISAKLVAGKMI